jgi:hypothetical protein
MKKAEVKKKLGRLGSMALWTISGMLGGDPAQMLDARRLGPEPHPDDKAKE